MKSNAQNFTEAQCLPPDHQWNLSWEDYTSSPRPSSPYDTYLLPFCGFKALPERHSSCSQEIIPREMADCSDPARWGLIIGRGGKHDLVMLIQGSCTIGSSHRPVGLLRFVHMAMLLGFLN